MRELYRSPSQMRMEKSDFLQKIVGRTLEERLSLFPYTDDPVPIVNAHPWVMNRREREGGGEEVRAWMLVALNSKSELGVVRLCCSLVALSDLLNEPDGSELEFCCISFQTCHNYTHFTRFFIYFLQGARDCEGLTIISQYHNYMSNIALGNIQKK